MRAARGRRPSPSRWRTAVRSYGAPSTGINARRCPERVDGPLPASHRPPRSGGPMTPPFVSTATAPVELTPARLSPVPRCDVHSIADGGRRRARVDAASTGRPPRAFRRDLRTLRRRHGEARPRDARRNTLSARVSRTLGVAPERTSTLFSVMGCAPKLVTCSSYARNDPSDAGPDVGAFGTRSSSDGGSCAPLPRCRRRSAGNDAAPPARALRRHEATASAVRARDGRIVDPLHVGQREAGLRAVHTAVLVRRARVRAGTAGRSDAGRRGDDPRGRARDDAPR